MCFKILFHVVVVSCLAVITHGESPLSASDHIRIYGDSSLFEPSGQGKDLPYFNLTALLIDKNVWKHKTSTTTSPTTAISTATSSSTTTASATTTTTEAPIPGRDPICPGFAPLPGYPNYPNYPNYPYIYDDYGNNYEQVDEVKDSLFDMTVSEDEMPNQVYSPPTPIKRPNRRPPTPVIYRPVYIAGNSNLKSK